MQKILLKTLKVNLGPSFLTAPRSGNVDEYFSLNRPFMSAVVHILKSIIPVTTKYLSDFCLNEAFKACIESFKSSIAAEFLVNWLDSPVKYV